MTRRRIGLVLLLLSLAAFAGAGWLALEPWRLTMQAERVAGRVTEIARVEGGSRIEFRPVIAYTAADGRRRTVMAPPLQAHPVAGEVRRPGQNIGDVVTVLHDPATGRGALPGATGAWVLPLAVAGHALVLLALPGALLAWPWRRGEAPAGFSGVPWSDAPWRRGLLLAALVAFAGAGWLAWDSVSALRDDRLVFGTVVAVEPTGRHTVAPRIRWTEDGRPREWRGQGRLPILWGVERGDGLNLLIPQGRPDLVRPATFFDLWAFPLLCAAAGMFLLFARRMLTPPRAPGRGRLALPPSEVQRRIARGESVTDIRRAISRKDR